MEVIVSKQVKHGTKKKQNVTTHCSLTPTNVPSIDTYIKYAKTRMQDCLLI